MRDADLPTVLFFNINGSGMGHMNRCLSYARRLQGRARPMFFSLASAIEIIQEMGFEAEYFVSHYWTSSSKFAWNSELAVRLGLLLEHVRPQAVVFDGTWPFQGFIAACEAYAEAHPRPLMVWSNRGLMKEEVSAAPVEESWFDLVIQPGEPGAEAGAPGDGGRRLQVPPVCILRDAELMDKGAARAALGLPPDERLALFSLGPGNLKDVQGIGHGLIREFEAAGYSVVWARAPISVRDVELPAGVRPLSVYPLARYLRAFDAFVGAAGYNTCCEVVQAGVPSLLVPNTQLVDDQVRRAHHVATLAPAVVSACETPAERHAALQLLAEIRPRAVAATSMNGAELAAEAILARLPVGALQ